MSNAPDEDEFAELFGSAPAEQQSTNQNPTSTKPRDNDANVLMEDSEQSDENDDNVDDLDYESDENEDNVVDATNGALEDAQQQQVKEETMDDDAANVSVTQERTAKVIKDENTEKLLSDVSQRYQPMFPGAMEPKINNQVTEQDLEMDFEEHPWRKPQVNIEDYFNYGFTEETWTMYCKRQKMIRGQAAMSKPITVFTGFVSQDRTKKHESMETMKQARELQSGVVHDDAREEATLDKMPEEVISLTTAQDAPERNREPTASKTAPTRPELQDVDRRPTTPASSASGFSPRTAMAPPSRDARPSAEPSPRGAAPREYRSSSLARPGPSREEPPRRHHSPSRHERGPPPRRGEEHHRDYRDHHRDGPPPRDHHRDYRDGRDHRRPDEYSRKREREHFDDFEARKRLRR